jgi:hypothetical protein
MDDKDAEIERQRMWLKQAAEEKERDKERREEETTRFGLMALWFLPFFGMLLVDSASRIAAIWLVGGFVVFLIRAVLKRR